MHSFLVFFGCPPHSVLHDRSRQERLSVLRRRVSVVVVFLFCACLHDGSDGGASVDLSLSVASGVISLSAARRRVYV